jgi:hypothetical protein
MVWEPVTLYWVSISLALLWWWIGDALDPDTIIFIVLFMKLGGGVATLLFLTGLGSASTTQILNSCLSLLAYLFVLVVLGADIGFKNLFRGFYTWIK